MDVTPTKHGLRFSQHGVVISELRTTAGPTHSVFDVLAALIGLLRPSGRVAMLGFAGGGMIAPLQALGINGDLTAVDLDKKSYQLFRRYCPAWAQTLTWQHGDAAQWLRRASRKFDVVLDDLSVPQAGDVIKPEVCWNELPDLMRRRLETNGIAMFNLMSPPRGHWRGALRRLAKPYREARVIQFAEYENRILLLGAPLPVARMLGKQLRTSLRQIKSRQADRIRVETLRQSGRFV